MREGSEAVREGGREGRGEGGREGGRGEGRGEWIEECTACAYTYTCSLHKHTGHTHLYMCLQQAHSPHVCALQSC